MNSFLEGDKCKYFCEHSLSLKIFFALDRSVIPRPNLFLSKKKKCTTCELHPYPPFQDLQILEFVDQTLFRISQLKTICELDLISSNNTSGYLCNKDYIMDLLNTPSMFQRIPQLHFHFQRHKWKHCYISQFVDT